MLKKIAALAALLVVFGLEAGCIAGTTLGSRQKYVASNPGLDPQIKAAIIEGTLCMGMSERDVVASIGYPDRVNRDTYQYGTRAQFCYNEIGGNFNFNRFRYVYFENGRVTSWSE